MGLPAFQLDPEAEKLVRPILTIYDPRQPSNIIALFPDESKGRLDPKWVPQRGTVAPTGGVKIGQTASQSTVALGLGVLIGWQLAEQDLREKQAEAEAGAQEFVQTLLGKRLQGYVEIILATEIAAMAAIALDIQNRELPNRNTKSPKRTQIHGYSRR